MVLAKRRDDGHVRGDDVRGIEPSEQANLDDGDIDGGPLSVTAFDAVSTQGGTVVVAADGSFSPNSSSGMFRPLIASR